MQNPISWAKARLNEPSTHAALCGILVAASWRAPAKDQPYVLGLAMVLGGFGMVLPEGLAKRVAAAEQSAAPPK